MKNGDCPYFFVRLPEGNRITWRGILYFPAKILQFQVGFSHWTWYHARFGVLLRELWQLVLRQPAVSNEEMGAED